MFDHALAPSASLAVDRDIVLSLRDVGKSYGGTQILRQVSFDVGKGEFAVVLGPSGSGKSTLFRCITRLTELSAGTVHYEGLCVNTLDRRGLAQLRSRIGFVFQQFNLIKRLSALDNVLTGRLASAPLWRVTCRSFSKADRQLALGCLDAVGMLDFAYRRVDGLSGGQQQRVAIARALAQQSHAIIADEPIASLDPESALLVMQVLGRVARDYGITVLCSLHHVDHALKMADRIIGMQAGRIVVDKPARDVSPEDLRSIYASAKPN
ncbi:phosphonate transport system ATP-binding protein [Enhydrobacter aerosaccus]|uniref:Phosphonate transport system ATP-binding protein n=1 Tax=Enhydrobacter aerosaccus TaxID=225324 RepID=A0A1T4RI24_9HYPH|nr:phosphonate ABC transporter ATP-binding protein [Enhydrobacter aerosaccus]SKA15650.1 phosphonate transport system ATP-binding protein [Enhydrobacter aerosaccus]